MRIRTANGVGFVRLWSALVIVLVLVMSGSAAFGQQSGKAIKPKKAATGQSAAGQVNDKIINKTSSKKADGVKPRPMPKEQEATIQTDPVYVDADGPEDGPRTSPPPFTEPASPYNSAGGGADAGGGSSSGSSNNPPIMQERCISCSCSSDHAGPEFPDPNCNGLHKFYYEWVYTHRYEACAQAEHTDLHICQSGRITAWTFDAIKYRFSNCSGVPDQNERVFKQGNNATGLTQSAAGVDFPLCRQ